MRVIDFYKTYNLHDSLLESITAKQDAKEVTLYIDFCYWMQKKYQDGDAETGMIQVVFHGVTRLEYPAQTPNSDEIVSCAISDENTLLLTARNDVADLYYTVSISAEDVTVTLFG